MTNINQVVKNTKSPLSWTGGKSLMCERLIGLMPQHTIYSEVFAGAAWVLFRKPPSKIEAINDINGDLISFYRCVQRHPQDLIRLICRTPVSRELFSEFKHKDSRYMTDLERALKLYYTVKLSYAAKIVEANFSVFYRSKKYLALRPDKVRRDLMAAHKRLTGVTIENLSWEKMLSSADSEDTLHFIDPPYWDCWDYYGKNLFDKEQFIRMIERLKTISGKFMLTINDVPEVRELCQGFHITPMPTRYSTAKDAQKKVTELLVTNFEVTA